MDTLPTLSSAPTIAPGNSPLTPILPPVMPGGGTIPFSKKCKCGTCPQCVQRAKWREKARKRATKLNGENSPEAPAPVAGVDHPGATPNLAPPSVAHSADDWKPVVETLVGIGEKASVTILQAKADRCKDEEISRLVREGAPWNPASKEAILRTGPRIFAKAAEKIGLPAEAADMTIFCAATGQIALQHCALISKLDKAIERMETATKRVEQAAKGGE
jgi:hypothetical protein